MELEKWIANQLTHGVDVVRKFPYKYDSDNGGFGYNITLTREEGSQNEKVSTKTPFSLVALLEPGLTEIRMNMNTARGLKGKQ